MSNITDLEERINSAEAVLEALSAELESIKQQEQPEPEPESLLGRWATHKEYGRGIITSIKPDSTGEVRFAYRNSSYSDGVHTRFARPESLTLDPVTLNTTDELQAAPDYTIAEELDYEQTVFMKHGASWFPIGDDTEIESGNMAPCRVIRWGNGQ